MSRDDTLAALQDLKKQVHDLPPDVAAATLVALLRSGEDAPTGLGFVVGDEGVLAESPRYRVALLDLLGQTDPDTAVAYSRSILAETTQPDEYALALRNLAWLDHEGTLTAEVSSRFSAMLDRTDWLAAPTTGYLEAFDIAVAVGGNAMISELSSVLRLTTHDPAVDRAKIDRAAFIALDRIMQREPDSIAALFTADPTFLDFAPNHRASLLSRLDPASPSGQKTLRTYLQSIPPAGEELAYFIKIFPNPNSFEGNRLVTSWETSSTPTTSITRRDQAALAFVETLLTESTYVDLAPPLQTLRTRLLTLHASSRPGPILRFPGTRPSPTFPGQHAPHRLLRRRQAKRPRHPHRRSKTARAVQLQIRPRLRFRRTRSVRPRIHRLLRRIHAAHSVTVPLAFSETVLATQFFAHETQ